MEITYTGFLSGLVFGAVGVYYFRKGKKNQNYYQFGLGILLCVFDFFISSPTVSLLTGVVLWALAYNLD